MGQCFTKQLSVSPNPLSPKPRISQVAPYPPKRRIQRTRSKVIYNATSLFTP